MQRPTIKYGPLLRTILVLAFLLFAISWGIWKYQYRPKARVNPVQAAISSHPTPQKMTKAERQALAGVFAQKIRDGGMEATVTITDDEASTIDVKSADIDDLIIEEITRNEKAQHDLYVMGFRHLKMTDGRTIWKIDLRD